MGINDMEESLIGRTWKLRGSIRINDTENKRIDDKENMRIGDTENKRIDSRGNMRIKRKHENR